MSIPSPKTPFMKNEGIHLRFVLKRHLDELGLREALNDLFYQSRGLLPLHQRVRRMPDRGRVPSCQDDPIALGK